ncbi:hypothetical protein BC828DRAFT_376459 [Blastocladiella britannica]|nr:hypothetical protein BC828DRAFT_376459 [Blastocladiella britannica]
MMKSQQPSMGTLSALPQELHRLIIDHLMATRSKAGFGGLRALMYCSRDTFQLAASRMWLSIWFFDPFYDVEALHRMTQALWILRDTAAAEDALRAYPLWVRDLDLLALEDDDDDGDDGPGDNHNDGPRSRPLAVLLATRNLTRLALGRSSSALASVCRGSLLSKHRGIVGTEERGPFAALLPYLRELVIYTRSRETSVPVFLGSRLQLLASNAHCRPNLAAINIDFDAPGSIADLRETLVPLAHAARAGELRGSLAGLRSISVTATCPALLAVAVDVMVGLTAVGAILDSLSVYQSVAGRTSDTDQVPAWATNARDVDLGAALAAAGTHALQLGGTAITEAMVAGWAPTDRLWQTVADLTLLRVDVDSRRAWLAMLRLAPPRALRALHLHDVVVRMKHTADIGMDDEEVATADVSAPAAAETTAAPVVPEIPCPWSTTISDIAATGSSASGGLTLLDLRSPLQSTQAARAIARVTAASSGTLAQVRLRVLGAGGTCLDAFLRSVVSSLPSSVSRAVLRTPDAWIELVTREQAAEMDAQEEHEEEAKDSQLEETPLPGSTNDSKGEQQQSSELVLAGSDQLAQIRDGRLEIRTYAKGWVFQRYYL